MKNSSLLPFYYIIILNIYDRNQFFYIFVSHYFEDYFESDYINPLAFAAQNGTESIIIRS